MHSGRAESVVVVVLWCPPPSLQSSASFQAVGLLKQVGCYHRDGADKEKMDQFGSQVTAAPCQTASKFLQGG